MRKGFMLMAGAVLTATFALSADAQKMTQTGPGSAGSPHVKTEWTLGGANVSISYGRPYLKGRSETTMMPEGKPWRTGADEATVITSDKAFKIGTIALAPGSYTINTIPGKAEWQIVVGKLGKAGQWGVPYQSALEIGRTPMSLTKSKESVEQVTYDIDKTAMGGMLHIKWGTQSASVPVTINK